MVGYRVRSRDSRRGRRGLASDGQEQRRLHSGLLRRSRAVDHRAADPGDPGSGPVRRVRGCAPAAPGRRAVAPCRSGVGGGGRAEVGTNVPPLILAISNPSAQTAHTLTVVEDLADATLFASIALFAIAVALKTSSWLRALSLIVGVLTLTRAVAGPLGVTILDTVAPIAFLALVLAVSIHMLITRPGRQAA